jgi:hypothetical protein
MDFHRFPMRIKLGFLAVAVSSLFVASAVAQAPPDEGVSKVLLNVIAGAPLRLYLTNRVSKRAGAPVQAKIMEPVFAFDREVIPAGTVALGRVSRTQAVGKWERVRALSSMAISRLSGGPRSSSPH